MLAAETGEGIKDLLREVVRDALQELTEEELTSTIGAAKHERTDTRTAQRNGNRDRLVSTPAGDVNLKIPRLRKGSFFPEGRLYGSGATCAVDLHPRRRLFGPSSTGIHPRHYALEPITSTASSAVS